MSLVICSGCGRGTEACWCEHGGADELVAARRGTGDRLAMYWDRASSPPVPGDWIVLDDGRDAIVDTAHASDGGVSKRKLTVIVPESSA